jgi:hypothetical protein
MIFPDFETRCQFPPNLVKLGPTSLIWSTEDKHLKFGQIGTNPIRRCKKQMRTKVFLIGTKSVIFFKLAKTPEDMKEQCFAPEYAMPMRQSEKRENSRNVDKDQNSLVSRHNYKMFAENVAALLISVHHGAESTERCLCENDRKIRKK